MDEVKAVLTKLEEDMRELLRLERDITHERARAAPIGELLGRYQVLSMRIFNQVRQDRKEI